MGLVKNIIDKFITLVALSNSDRQWQASLNTSVVFSPWVNIRAAASKFGDFSKYGKLCQLLSFLCLLVLFFSLPAPQFASDKENIALIIVFGFSLRVLGLLLNGPESYKSSTIDLLVLFFLAFNVVAGCASHYFLPSLKGLAKLLVYVGAYFYFVGAFQKETTRRVLWTTIALLLAGSLEALYGLYQYKIGVAPLATWEDPSIEEKTTRIYGTLRNPNLLAGYFVPLIPLSLGLAGAALEKFGWRRPIFILPALISMLFTLACFLTGSRGGYLGIGAGIGFMALLAIGYLWVKRPSWRIAICLLVLLTPCVFLLALHQFPSYENRILSIFAGREHSSNSYRLNVYVASFKMFLDNWWFGIGPGNQTFRFAYGLYMKSGFDALGTYCVPLEIAVETGLFGLLSFFFLVAATMCRAHLTFWSHNSGFERWLTAGAAGGITAIMVHGLVDTVFYRPQVQLIFWLLVAGIVALSIRTKSNQETGFYD